LVRKVAQAALKLGLAAVETEAVLARTKDDDDDELSSIMADEAPDALPSSPPPPASRKRRLSSPPPTIVAVKGSGLLCSSSDDDDEVQEVVPPSTAPPSTSSATPSISSATAPASVEAVASAAGLIREVASDPDEETVECPVCMLPVRRQYINGHLDSCVLSAGSDHAGSVMEQDEVSARIARETARLDKAAAAREAADAVRAAARADHPRAPPAILFNRIQDKELKSILRSHGLDTRGTRDKLCTRYQDYRIRVQAELDADEPRPFHLIAAEVNAETVDRADIRASLLVDRVSGAQDSRLFAAASDSMKSATAARVRAAKERRRRKRARDAQAEEVGAMQREVEAHLVRSSQEENEAPAHVVGGQRAQQSTAAPPSPGAGWRVVQSLRLNRPFYYHAARGIGTFERPDDALPEVPATSTATIT
jgi:hypothetical protein